MPPGLEGTRFYFPDGNEQGFADRLAAIRRRAAAASSARAGPPLRRG